MVGMFYLKYIKIIFLKKKKINILKKFKNIKNNLKLKKIKFLKKQLKNNIIIV